MSIPLIPPITTHLLSLPPPPPQPSPCPPHTRTLPPPPPQVSALVDGVTKLSRLELAREISSGLRPGLTGANSTLAASRPLFQRGGCNASLTVGPAGVGNHSLAGHAAGEGQASLTGIGAGSCWDNVSTSAEAQIRNGSQEARVEPSQSEKQVTTAHSVFQLNLEQGCRAIGSAAIFRSRPPHSLSGSYH